MVEAVALAAGEEVELADHLGLIAGTGELGGEGAANLPGDVALHAEHAVDLGGLAGEDGAAGGDAGGALGVRAAEVGAGGTEVVQVRGGEDGVALDAETVAAPLVGEDQEQVGAPVGHGEVPSAEWGSTWETGRPFSGTGPSTSSGRTAL